MDGYDLAQICINGHVVTSMAATSPQFKSSRCKKCGAETICNCLNCNSPIKGYYHVSGVIGGFKYIAPRFCDSCGEPFPWIKIKLETAYELVDFIESLNSNEKIDFKCSISDLVKETAKMSIAKVKLKKYLSTVDNDISDGIKEVMKDILSEKLKNELII